VDAELPQSAVHSEHVAPRYFSQGAARQTQLDFELARAILGVAEPQAEPRVRFTCSIHIRNAIRVATDAQRPFARRADTALNPRQPLSKEGSKDPGLPIHARWIVRLARGRTSCLHVCPPAGEFLRFAELRSIVAESTPAENVAVVNLQLFSLLTR
jgi:hypothetical protein